MIETSQMPVTKYVRRSRFFSTTVEPERLDCTPPPNSVDKPPPLARCRSTNRITRTLVTTRVICRAKTMNARIPVDVPDHGLGSGQGPTGGDRRQDGELL